MWGRATEDAEKKEREGGKDWKPEAHKYGQEGRGPAAGRGGA